MRVAAKISNSSLVRILAVVSIATKWSCLRTSVRIRVRGQARSTLCSYITDGMRALGNVEQTGRLQVQQSSFQQKPRGPSEHCSSSQLSVPRTRRYSGCDCDFSSMILGRFQVAPHWSCSSESEILPQHDCLLSVEETKHKEVCGSFRHVWHPAPS